MSRNENTQLNEFLLGYYSSLGEKQQLTPDLQQTKAVSLCYMEVYSSLDILNSYIDSAYLSEEF